MKIKLNAKPSVSFSNESSDIASVGPANPSPSPASIPPPPKTTVKFSSKSKSTLKQLEAASQAKVSKAGRKRKDSAKLQASKQSIRDDIESEDEGTIAVQQPKRRSTASLKVLFKRTSQPDLLTPTGSVSTNGKKVPTKFKVLGKAPTKPLGTSYDSEASDAEADPAIEEAIILRFPPGEDCDYVRQCIAEKKLGSGGAEISMQFFDGEGRRAMIRVRKNIYAATVVDLPCIIEGMKSWDKRGWWKSADICQMLWAFKLVKNQAEAERCDLPSIIDQKTHLYPHGLTPPMQFARKRRFRKRTRVDEIEAIDAAVEKLLEEDDNAVSSSYAIIDAEAEARRASQVVSEMEDEEEESDPDADGEADLDDSEIIGQAADGFAEPMDEDKLAELEADLQAELEAVQDGDVDIAPTMVVTPGQLVETPQAAETEDEVVVVEEDQGEDSGDESIEDEEEMTEEDKERAAQIQAAKDEIADLEGDVREAEGRLAATGNAIIRKKYEEQIRKLKEEIELKRSAAGLDDEA